MTIAYIAQIIFEIIKLIPVLKSLFEQVLGLYYDAQIKDIEKQQNKKLDEFVAIYNAIKKAETNEERAALSKVLFNLNNTSR